MATATNDAIAAFAAERGRVPSADHLRLTEAARGGATVEVVACSAGRRDRALCPPSGGRIVARHLNVRPTLG